MTERERLIELCLKCDKDNDVLECFNERPTKRQAAEILADYLLANGGIVPPCKVGQTVYVINSLWVSEYRVEAFWWDGLMFNFKGENEDYADECSVFYFFDERIGKTVFLTREEAEKALAERSRG